MTVGNLFYRLGNNKLLYDDDLRPEGVAPGIVVDRYFANSPAFRSAHRTAGPDAVMWRPQAKATVTY